MLGKVLPIKRIKYVSFFLFLVPTIALLGSLFIHNILVSAKFNYPNNYSTVSFNTKFIICNEDNDFCNKDITKNLSNDLFSCSKNRTQLYYDIENRLLLPEDYHNSNALLFPPEYQNLLKSIDREMLKQTKIINIFKKTDDLNQNCIKNNKLYKIYSFLPYLAYKIISIRNNDKYGAATSKSVYPFLFGETSISNIVKRFPINFIFKPLIYIGSILMIIYWYTYNKTLNLIIKQNKLQKFFIFGLLSSFFLVLHVYFLGTSLEGEVIKKLRKIFIVLFILFEVLAQFFLVKSIKYNFNLVESYIKKTYLNLKIYLLIIVILATFIILIILVFYELNKPLHYFLEWNYFLILLFFYLLSSLMWKKTNS